MKRKTPSKDFQIWFDQEDSNSLLFVTADNIKTLLTGTPEYSAESATFNALPTLKTHNIEEGGYRTLSVVVKYDSSTNKMYMEVTKI